jgi:transcriptional antiterminator NusG
MSNQNNQNNEITNNDTNFKWYIVQTYVGFEEAVRKALELKIDNLGLQDRISEIYTPIRKVIKLNKKGERQEKIEKIYPGYIYLKMLLDKEIGYLIQNTNYVSRIAGTGDFAVALDDGYVEKLKEELMKESEETQATTTTSYRLGDLVMVIDGPFKDMQGKVSGLDTMNSTVDVLLTMFERETMVTLDSLAIKKML